jgi:hypothetical protein
MVTVPTPAVDGSNVPVVALVIPGPLHVPPPSTAVKVIDGSFTQNGPTTVMVASNVELTETVTVEVVEHPFAETVTVYVPLSPGVAETMVGFCSAEVNPFGPLHAYVAPAAVVAVRFKSVPVQIGEFEPAVVVGAAFTVTFTVEVEEQPFAVTVTVYVPLAAVVAEAIVGFCNAEVNPFGPLQAYVAPAAVVAVKFKLVPAQMGEFEPAVVVGIALTVTFTVEVEEQPFAVTVTVYVPLAAVVAEAMVGFCNADVNPFGPLHAYVAPADVVAVKFNALPAQIGEFEPAVVVGIGLTVMVEVAVPVPQAPVPVTVYVVVVLGEAVTVAPVVALNPAAGDQV